MRRLKMRKSMWYLLVCFLCVSLPLVAQKVTGTIAGVVSDPAGAVISGAEITATNPATGATRTVKSSDHGEYSFADLPAGSYDITAKHANFKDYASKDAHLFVCSRSTARRWARSSIS